MIFFLFHYFLCCLLLFLYSCSLGIYIFYSSISTSPVISFGISSPNSLIIVVVPDNPLPSLDPNAATVVDDDTEKVVSEEGGGSVTMYYSLDASISLADGTVELYFVNPNASNHSVTLELCIVDGDNEYVVSSSGLIPAGMGITTMSFDRNSVALSAGNYEGKLKVYAYDSMTGEKAITQMEITDLTISVS